MSGSAEAHTPGTTRIEVSFGVAALLIGTAVWLILTERDRAGGAAAAAAGVVSLWAGFASRRGPALVWVADSIVDRLYDGAILAAIAWQTRSSSPVVAAAALVAMAAGFLGAYIRAKGIALGYGVDESPVTRGLRYLFISLGLIAGWLAWTLWAAAIVSVVAVFVRTSQVAKEEQA